MPIDASVVPAGVTSPINVSPATLVNCVYHNPGSPAAEPPVAKVSSPLPIVSLLFVSVATSLVPVGSAAVSSIAPAALLVVNSSLRIHASERKGMRQKMNTSKLLNFFIYPSSFILWQSMYVVVIQCPHQRFKLLS